MNITEIITALREKAEWCVLARQKADKALFTSAADALEAAKRDTERLSFCIRWGYLDCITDYVANDKLEPRECIDFLIEQCLGDHAINAAKEKL